MAKVKTLTRAMLLMYGVYAGLSLAVLLPLLARGYVLTLDMVFTPKLRMPDTTSASYLFHALLHVLSAMLPSDIIQKILLFLVLFLAGVGMHRLVQLVQGKDAGTYHTVGAYVAGLLYMINPFTYDRLMAGQYSVLLGYALLPFVVRALLRFFRKPSWDSTIVATLWTLAISIVSIHLFGPVLILALVGTCLILWRRRAQKPYLGAFTRYALLGIVLFIAASSYWLIPTLVGKSNTAQEIASFTPSDNAAFTTVGSNAIAKISNVVRLQGFWAEDRGLYTLPQAHIPSWGLVAVMIWLLVIGGGISLWRNNERFMLWWLGISGLIGLTLAVGSFNGWLGAHIPLFAGYREPQKFVALVVLAYALLAARGVAVALTYCKRELEYGGAPGAAATILLLLPIVFTPTMLWGANSQLQASHYPAEWYTVNQLLNRDASGGQALFLPWHLYMGFNFAGRIIANPAPSFFDRPMLVSDNPEFHGAALAGSTPIKRQVDRILQHAASGTTLGAELTPLNVKYVLLTHDNDYRRYNYLNSQTDLQLAFKSASIDVYRNTAYQGK